MPTFAMPLCISRKKLFLRSLREYLEALSAIRELVEVKREVDWNLEMGAVIRRSSELEAPAPLFQYVHGVEKGFRVLGTPVGISRQPGLNFSRLALSLGLNPRASAKEMIDTLVTARTIPGIPPRILNSGPCKENIVTGDEVNLFRFPAPVMEAVDGRRNFGSWATVVTQTPDKSWTDWGFGRLMILDRNHMTGIVDPGQHQGMILGMWEQIGQPMPFAIFQGGPPFASFVSRMRLPVHTSEVDFMGGFFEEAVDLVRCETVDLEVPATAEIVVEGFLSVDHITPEFGESAGYGLDEWGGRAPVYNVTALTYRSDPILPVVPPSIDEGRQLQGLPIAAGLLGELREIGIPATLAWLPRECAHHWLVVSVAGNWRQRTGATSEGLCRTIGKHVFEKSKYGGTIWKVLVMNDDIDISNTTDVVWALATRCHPEFGEIQFGEERLSRFVAFPHRDGNAGGSMKAVYNCLLGEDPGTLSPLQWTFRHSYPPELQAKVIANWTLYGFEPTRGSQ